MGVHGRFTGPTPEEFMQKVRRGVQEAMDEAIEEAQRAVENFIATRGTPKSGKQGRVDTGRMLDSVTSTTENSGDVFYGGVGWSDFQLYFALQEEGFTHLGGSQVPAMNAFMDAYPLLREDLLRKLSEKLGAI